MIVAYLLYIHVHLIVLFVQPPSWFRWHVSRVNASLDPLDRPWQAEPQFLSPTEGQSLGQRMAWLLGPRRNSQISGPGAYFYCVTVYFISHRIIFKTLDNFGIGQNVGALQMELLTCTEPITASVLGPVALQFLPITYPFISISWVWTFS